MYMFSQIRQIPDHQEVYSDATTDQSIIIELNNYIEQTECNETTIGTYYMNDLAEVNEATNTRILVQQSSFTATELPLFQDNQDNITAYYIIGEQHISKFKEQARNIIHIYMAIIRLKNVKTDLLVTFNIPVVFSGERYV